MQRQANSPIIHPPTLTSRGPLCAGTVLKRFDSTKLFALACQDVVERFHLLLILAFVVVEEMGNRCGRATRGWPTERVRLL